MNNVLKNVINGTRSVVGSALNVGATVVEKVTKGGSNMENVTVRKVTLANHGATRGFADVTLFGKIVAKGYRVVQRKDGSLFVGNPALPGKKKAEGAKDNWFDQIYITDATLRNEVNQAILTAYGNAVATQPAQTAAPVAAQTAAATA